MAESDVKLEEGHQFAYPPRLPFFSGEEKDTPFELWRFEIQCLLREGKTENAIKMAIRRSLKGQASRTLLALGVEASVKDILTKFEAVFGSTETAQTILSKFYSLKQKELEDAGSFASRLEDTIQRAVTLGRVQREETNALLCEAFEGGLLRRTRAATSYLFQSITDFNRLQVEVKRKERDLGLLQPQAATNSAEVAALNATVKELQGEIESLKLARRSYEVYAMPSSPAPAQPVRHQPVHFRPPRPPAPTYQRFHHPRSQPREPACWNCGMPGHVAIGCRMGGPLNSRRPTSRGRPRAP